MERLYGRQALAIAYATLLSCEDYSHRDALSVEVRGAEVNPSAFSVTAEIAVRNNGLSDLADITCFSWHTPEVPGISWGGSLFSIKALRVGATEERVVETLSSRMQFERAISSTAPAMLKLTCSGRSRSRRIEARPATYRLSDEGDYVPIDGRVFDEQIAPKTPRVSCGTLMPFRPLEPISRATTQTIGAAFSNGAGKPRCSASAGRWIRAGPTR
jgi:hypothetical protein